MSQRSIQHRLSLLIGLAALPAAAQSVKFEKFTLDNGMTVILHEDRSLPVAAINLWYRVGSKDEPIRRSGFAHLFEHLMFMGTERAPGNEFDLIMEAAGGSNNASTSSDRTNYFASGPSSLLPTLLWLEADRLEDLARMMDQEKLDKQRDIVRNERRQMTENTPYGILELIIPDMMYPPGHPYHIPVIGSHEDLEAATVRDVKDFFAAYYVPNNVTLCVAGDFDPKETRKLIEELFGSLPRGQRPMRRTAPPAVLEQVKRTTVYDQVQLPLVCMNYHAPAWYADGDAECELLADVLAEGKSSRLYKRLVYDEKVAVEVSAHVESGELGSILSVRAYALPGSDLDQVEKLVDEEIERVLRDGVTADELERHKAARERSALEALQSIEARADKLNEYEYCFGQPDSFKRDLDRFRNATPESVKAWAAKVLTQNGRVIARVLPIEPPREPSPRDRKPDVTATRTFSPPSPETFKLSNGIPVMLWRKPELPLVCLSLVARTGSALDVTGKAGLASLTAEMLSEGAGDLDTLAFENAIQAIGAEFESHADHDSATVSLSTLARHFERGAALLADAVQRPRLDAAEFDRVKRLRIEDLRNREDDPRQVSTRVAAANFFGLNHPYGWPVDGVASSVAAIELSDVKTAHAATYRPEHVTLVVAGDLTVDQAKAALEKSFSGWKPTGAAAPAIDVPPPPSHDSLRVIIVHRPEAVQTMIRFIAPGPKFDDARRVPLRVLNTLLGGTFTSRLNLNLRETRGYTYGCRSSYVMDALAGYFTAGCAVKADVTGPAIKEFLHELTRTRGGDIQAAEMVKARESLKVDAAQAFQSLDGIVGAAAGLVSVGKPFDTLKADLDALSKVTLDELNRIAGPAIPIEKGVLVLVGDRELIKSQIAPLNLPAAKEEALN